MLLITSMKRRMVEIKAAAKTRAKADTVCSMSIDLNLLMLLMTLLNSP